VDSSEYFPELSVAERRRLPSLDLITEVLGGAVTVTEVPVPIDCTDGFTDAFYARPEAFLDPAVRAGQSAWAFIDEEAINAGLARLARDLREGAWDDAHGHLRTQASFTGALRLVVAQPAPH
jgi:hypothetical protein